MLNDGAVRFGGRESFRGGSLIFIAMAQDSAGLNERALRIVIHPIFYSCIGCSTHERLELAARAPLVMIAISQLN